MIDNLTIVKDVLKEYEDREHLLQWRYPSFNLVYNWIIAMLLIGLFISFGIWGVDVHIQRKSESMAATALASYQAEEQAKADEIAHQQALYEQSEEVVTKKMAESLAKLFFGADKFREKYHYGDEDFRTLARCVFNRVENPAYSDDIYEVINQKDQWVGYYDSNPVLDEYFDLALTSIREWRSETVKPVSNDYLWSEYTPNGIFLKNDFHANGYARRWRAS